MSLSARAESSAFMFDPGVLSMAGKQLLISILLRSLHPVK
jgi:hypothetical protein